MIYLLELDDELDEAPEPVTYWSRIALKALSTTLTLYFLRTLAITELVKLVSDFLPLMMTLVKSSL